MNGKTLGRKTGKGKPNPGKTAEDSPKTIEVEFIYESPTAKEVYLAGDFNNWSFNSLPMRKTEDGKWRIRVPLSPGRHEYRYLVDGEWQCDPSCCDYVPNPFGSCNCVVVVRPMMQPGSDGMAVAPKNRGGNRAQAWASRTQA